MLINTIKFLKILRSNNKFLFLFKTLIICFVVLFFYNIINKDNFFDLLDFKKFNFIIFILLIISILSHLFFSSLRWYLLLNSFEKYKNFKKVYYVSIYGYLSDQISVLAFFLSRYLLFAKGPSTKSITLSSIIEKILSLFVKLSFVLPAFIYYLYIDNNILNYFLIILFFILILFTLTFLYRSNQTYFNSIKIYILLNNFFHRSILISFLLHFINLLSFLLIFYLFQINFVFTDIVIYLPLAILISSLQVIFGQIGIREISFYFVFQYTNVSTEQILLISLFYTLIYSFSLTILTFFNYLVFNFFKIN